MKHACNYRGYYLAFLVAFIACRPPQNQKVLTESEKHLPENALAGLSVGEGMVAQLFAHEPMVKNPTAIDIDHKGRVWVTENVNYRPFANPDNLYQEEGDKILILEDTDGDGKADLAKDFYQGKILDGAMGIAVLGKKVYVSVSPHILVFSDEDEDDKADDYEILFTGIGKGQNDHSVHAFSFGPDGKMYFNTGNGSHEVLDKEGQPIQDNMGNIVKADGNPYRQGMVFRCNPDGSDFEVLGHNFRNNYEVCVDSYGNMFQSDNDDDGNKAVRINYVMEYGNFGYKDELTGEAWGKPRTGMHPDIPARHWHQNDPGVVPNLLITGSGSPTGILVYEGSLLPKIYHGKIIHADAGPGVVRGYITEKDGVGFSATISNILKKDQDPWFRPSDVCIAPDGSLFASDWYDPGVGGNLAGDNLSGRIFRITTPRRKKYTIQALDVITIDGAVKALQNPNIATRFLGWTALADAGKAAEKALLDLYSSHNPHHRARALWLLGRLSPGHLNTALEDKDPNLRVVALRAARQLYPSSLMSFLEKAEKDASPLVLAEVAIALHGMKGIEAGLLWSKIAYQYDGKDRWYLEALGIGAEGNWDDAMRAWYSEVGNHWKSPEGMDIIWRSRASNTFDYLEKILSYPDREATQQARFIRATDFHFPENKDERLANLLSKERTDHIEFNRMLLSHISPSYVKNSPKIIEEVNKILPGLRGTMEYVELVGQLELKSEAEGLFEMVLENPGHELGVRAGAVLFGFEGKGRFERALFKGTEAEKNAMLTALTYVGGGQGKKLLHNFSLDESQEIDLRKRAIDGNSFGWGWAERMIALLETGDLPKDLESYAAAKLLTSPRAVDREVAMVYLPTENSALPSISNMASQEGDLKTGQEHFQLHCASCHIVDGVGIDFGPDLSEIGNKLGKDALLGAILHPSAGISHGFEGYMVEMGEGDLYTGYILSENDTEVVMRMAGGVRKSVPRSEIKSKKKMENSLMTHGLGEAMGEKALVDLVSYLSNLKNVETLSSNPFQGQIGYQRN